MTQSLAKTQSIPKSPVKKQWPTASQSAIPSRSTLHIHTPILSSVQTRHGKETNCYEDRDTRMSSTSRPISLGVSQSQFDGVGMMMRSPGISGSEKQQPSSSTRTGPSYESLHQDTFTRSYVEELQGQYKKKVFQNLKATEKMVEQKESELSRAREEILRLRRELRDKDEQMAQAISSLTEDNEEEKERLLTQISRVKKECEDATDQLLAKQKEMLALRDDQFRSTIEKIRIWTREQMDQMEVVRQEDRSDGLREVEHVRAQMHEELEKIQDEHKKEIAILKKQKNDETKRLSLAQDKIVEIQADKERSEIEMRGTLKDHKRKIAELENALEHELTRISKAHQMREETTKKKIHQISESYDCERKALEQRVTDLESELERIGSDRRRQLEETAHDIGVLNANLEAGRAATRKIEQENEKIRADLLRKEQELSVYKHQVELLNAEEKRLRANNTALKREISRQDKLIYGWK
eukprot:gnl/Carplike_NY0171/3947_a5330_300.p1 GENE.gnl/Carplike_NY0171/3947_a5330_300~~gnl/Carplike_NY0171/3947_a5330_300.p1  ORF type:complete len:533 (-),score=162.81 gnl/Carplike_NY0171/3947_a5330_300:21-1430(-)